MEKNGEEDSHRIWGNERRSTKLHRHNVDSACLAKPGRSQRKVVRKRSGQGQGCEQGGVGRDLNEVPAIQRPHSAKEK